MIVYLVTADHAYTLNKYLKEWAPGLDNEIQPIFYEENPWDWLTEKATYVFSDIERLTPSELGKATAYADVLIAKGFRVLNHPSYAPTRLSLQDILFEAGINPFRMAPVADAKAFNFPVFLRLANSHQGSIGDLIHSQAELAERLSSLDKKIAQADDLVVVEYCDTRNEKNRYVKCSVMRVGDHYVPRHLMTSDRWMIKTPDILDDDALRAERDFLLDFKLQKEVEEIFRLAKLDFGRIDFGLQDGQIRVWEINTNPVFMPALKNLHPSRADIVGKTNEWLIDALKTLGSPTTDSAVWDKTMRRHKRSQRLWWLQRKLFRRKRA